MPTPTATTALVWRSFTRCCTVTCSRPTPHGSPRFAQNVWGIDPAGKSELKLAQAGVEALAAFIKEIGMPTTFAELGIPADTDLKAVADSTVLTGGCCKKLSREELLDILNECK